MSEVVSLKVSLLDHSEDVVTEIAGMAALYCSNDVDPLFFDCKWLDFFFLAKRGLALAAVLPLPLSLDLASAVLQVECPQSALGLSLPAVSGEEREVMKVL